MVFVIHFLIAKSFHFLDEKLPLHRNFTCKKHFKIWPIKAMEFLLVTDFFRTLVQRALIMGQCNPWTKSLGPLDLGLVQVGPVQGPMVQVGPVQGPMVQVIWSKDYSYPLIITTLFVTKDFAVKSNLLL